MVNETKRRSFYASAEGIVKAAAASTVKNEEDYGVYFLENNSITFKFSKNEGKVGESVELVNGKKIKLSFEGKSPVSGEVRLYKNGDIEVVNLTDGTYYANKDVDTELTLSPSNPSPSREELQALIEELQKEIEALKEKDKELTEKDKEIDQNKIEITTLKEKINDLEGCCNKDPEVDTSLLERINEVEDKNVVQDTNINTNTTDIEALKKKVNENSTSITENSTSINNLTTSVNTNASNIASNTTKINNLTTNVNTNKTSISNLTTTVNNISTTVNTNKTDITELKKKVDASNTSISTNATNISNINKTVTSLSTTVNTNKTNISNLTSTVNSLSATVSSISTGLLAKTYPVGSIYISTSSTNPATIFGGTWEAYGTGRTLVGINTSDANFNTVSKTGGEYTHTLTINEMPSHTHTQNAHTHALSTGTVSTKSLVGKFLNVVYQDEWNMGWAEGIVSTGVGTKETAKVDGLKQIKDTDEGFTIDATHNHTLSGNAGNATAVNQNTGGGVAHNNIQPYITVYMWKRVS